MSGHTNRNKRNGGNWGNPRSRRGPPRQRGADGRPGSQPKNDVPPAAEPEIQDSEQAPTKDHNRPIRAPQPPTQSMPPTGPIGNTGSERAPSDGDDASPDEPVRPHDQPLDRVEEHPLRRYRTVGTPTYQPTGHVSA